MVERLTGKLSQLLRKVQGDKESDNKDLVKYSFGMILSACIENLDAEGVEEIYDKFREKAEELKEEDDFVPDEDDEE